LRQLVLAFAFLCLSACGNASSGKAFTPYNYAHTSAAQSTVAGGTSTAAAQPLYCRSPFLATPDLTTDYAGSTLCATQVTSGAGIKGASVLLHVNSNVPANTPLCIVPFVNDNATTETCFTVSTQVLVTLTTDQYTSLVVLPQAALAAYKLFLSNPGSLAPSRVVFSM
jgi:hypothetical protein